MHTTTPDSVYDVLTGMLKEAVPLKKNNKCFDPSTLLSELGMDSLETLSLAMDLEEHFGVVIPDEKVKGFERVEDIALYLETLIHSPQSDALATAL